MKVNDFSHMIEGQYQSITAKSGKTNNDAWEIITTNSNLNVRSNLDTFESVNIESTSKLFLGNNATPKWLDETFKSIMLRELEFID